jgi:predicted PurR-regulated permease PerM
MLLDGPKIWSLFLGLFPHKYTTHLNEIKHRIDSNLSSLITGQFKIAALTAVTMLITYIAIGNRYAIILACFQMLEFIPILGTWTAIIPSLIIVAATSGINKAVIALIVYLIYGQIIRDHILAPRIMGNAFGVHPLAVIFGLLISVQIFGLVGILVGLPIIGIISATLDYLIKLREMHNFDA